MLFWIEAVLAMIFTVLLVTLTVAFLWHVLVLIPRRAIKQRREVRRD